MSDQINLAIGANPWQPSGGSELVEEYSHYDAPTAGVLSQAGCYFLFECVEGIAYKFSVWVYAPITDQEEEFLSSLSGEMLAVAMDEIWRSRQVTVALASKDEILTGGTLNGHEISDVGIRLAALERLRSVVDLEVGITEALER